MASATDRNIVERSTTRGAGHAATPTVPRPRQSTENDAPRPTAENDPMGDVESLLREIRSSQVDRRKVAFLSFFVHFTDRTKWEHAATVATEQKWQVASYSQAGSHVLRLSYSCKPTAERLEKLRSVMHTFAAETGGTWESIAIEAAEPTSKWAELADKYVPHVEPPPKQPAATDSPEALAAPKQSRPRTKTHEQRSA